MSQESRRKFLASAIERYGVCVDDDCSGGEDMSAVIEGLESGEELPRWFSVTAAGEHRYGRVHNTLVEAKDQAIENIADDIYAEAPVAIVDLDTGRTRAPAFYRVAWIASSRLEAKNDESAESRTS